MHVIDILLVEDNPGDVRLTIEALKESKIHTNLHFAQDGIEALAFLQDEANVHNRPDLILLDLNLPRMGGQELLAIIKEDPDLKQIPVVILTTSDSERDIIDSYNLHANCYVTKPVDLEQFIRVVQSVEDFWLTIVKLPPRA